MSATPTPPQPRTFVEERVALGDLQDYLDRHSLVVVKAEHWRKKGLVLFCKKEIAAMERKLTEGWLWFDDDPKSTLEEKVERAAQMYEEKHGHAPGTCCVHPETIAGDELRVNGLCVVAARNVLLHHFWLGVADRGLVEQ
jgi:hypothetical protein